MPVFLLNEDIFFPPVYLARNDGLLAVGGDLSKKRLIQAYKLGIFPWFSEGDPLLWWSPDPRLVMFLDEFKPSRSLRQVIKRCIFTVTFDKDFCGVINNCAAERLGKPDGTWLTEEMIRAYIGLHKSGYAHSVECWQEGELSGGLYGVAIGKMFFGESMFTKVSNASKTAFAFLVEKLIELEFHLIDCQVRTEHLVSMGAREITGEEFQAILKAAVKPPLKSIWQ
ncbi:leucyl/phenylalanyl-tRNA--protein transferase [Candidatus Magnetomonas plexicatena]|uniref:leucyl/phenylalanyl-tRNA--protein transferase n=1 Tax=Candidatus Magnetomonas plexicatena TaxID=2552947 RepID=UPI001C74DB1D|nr:leucyl/phenylalanyl-tRNA--protein transferase [Nitrospirales bacterium LBB_01]